MSKKKKLIKLKKKNRKLNETLERYKNLLNSVYGSNLEGYPRAVPTREGFTPRCEPSMIHASEFDGDSLAPFISDFVYGEKYTTYLNKSNPAGSIPLYPHSTKFSEENPDKLGYDELILKYGRDIIKVIGHTAWVNNKKFNNVDDEDYLHLQLPEDSVAGRIISQYCKPMDFIFTEAQTGPSPSLYVMLEVFVTFRSPQGIEVADRPIEISIPLDNCKCPSHVIRVIRDSVICAMNKFVEYNKSILLADSGEIEWWVADIADYVLGMFIVSSIFNGYCIDEDDTSKFSTALLRDEIIIPHEISNIAIMFRTMMFENGHKTSCEANGYIIPIVDSKAILYDEYEEAFKSKSPASELSSEDTTNVQKASSACEAMGMDTD